MSDNATPTPESKESRGGKLNGVAVGGIINAKRETKPQDGRDAAYKVHLSMIGCPVMYSVKVSRSHYDQLREGQHAQFHVNQTIYEGKLYNTALYD